MNPVRNPRPSGRGGSQLFFDWTDACVAHPFFDLATIRRGTAFTDAVCEDELRERLREAYLPEWASFEPPGRLARAWELAAPLGALHQAVSYRSLATQAPMDPTWPSRPPSGCAGCWPWRDRRHPPAVSHGTAGPPPPRPD